MSGSTRTPLRILMVAPTPFFADRGCHVRILGEIQGLQSLGHEVVICTYPLGRDVPGVRTARTWPVPWYRKLSAGPSIHKYYIDLLLTGLVRRWIRRWQPDVIHAHLHEGVCIGAAALGRRRIPLVLDYQGSLIEEVVAHQFTKTGAPQHRVLHTIERWADHRADAIITSTAAAVTKLSEEFQVPQDRLHIVTDGVDVEQFQPRRNGTDIRKRFGVPDGRPLIVYTGLLNRYQGIDLLLESLSRVKQTGRPFHALLAGYPNEERYRAMAKTLGIADEVTLPGRLPFDLMPELLAASDIAVSAKLPSSEGNVKLYTYLSAGLPTVAFDTPMNREILGEAGVLVPLVNPAAFAEGLSFLLDQRARWEGLSRQARERAVSQFSWRSVAQRIEQVYAQVRSPRSRTQPQEHI